MIESLKNRIRSLRTIKRAHMVYLGIFLVLLVPLVLYILPSSHTDEATQETPRTVTLRPAGDLIGSSTPVALLGTVTSISEATIRGESSGRITVYKKLGNTVAAGEVIAQFENSGEKAAVLSAEGAYEAALAQKNISTIGEGSSANTLASAITAGQNAVDAANVSMTTAVRTTTDPFFSNPGYSDAHFVIQSSDSRLVMRVEEERHDLDRRLKEPRTAPGNDPDEVARALVATENDLRIVAAYLDDIQGALAMAIPSPETPESVIAANRGAVAGARSAISGSLSAVTGAKLGLAQAVAGAKVAQETSGSASDISLSGATVKSAEGNLLAARARLAKTIVRSPITGTINALPVESGDFLPPSAEIATVAQNGALEIVASMTEGDAARVTVGAEAMVGDTARGVVTRIAPALDPMTKKIEVRIGLTTGMQTLINGQSVRILIMKNEKVPAHTVTRTPGTPLSIPLSAIKITPAGSFVLTVDNDGVVRAIPVTLGRLLGEYVEVKDLDPTTPIISDARGLKEGYTVLLAS